MSEEIKPEPKPQWETAPYECLGIVETKRLPMLLRFNDVLFGKVEVMESEEVGLFTRFHIRQVMPTPTDTKLIQLPNEKTIIKAVS